MAADFFSFRSMRNLILLSLFIINLAGCNSPDEKQKQEDESILKPGVVHYSPLDSITDVIKEQGESAPLFLHRANLYMAYDNPQAAFNDINRARMLDSTSSEYHETKGEYHYMINQTRSAKDEWEKCLRSDPKNSVCIMRMAELMIAVRNYERALKLVNQQLEIDKNDPQAYFMKGIIIRDERKDTALALQYFQNAIDLKQDYIDAIDLMAVTLALQGDTLAKYYYQRILDLQPNSSDIYFKLGVFYMDQNEVNRAIESYTKAIQINPRDADSYYNLAYIHLELDLFQQAREYFSKAIQHGERPYKSYYGRGYTFEVVGDLENARKDYRKSLEILPMYTPGQEALARVNRLINQN